MNISSLSAYINELSSSSRIGAKISLGILIYVLISAVIGLLFGLKRGFSKTVVRTLTFIASAIISFFICSWAIGWALSFVEGKTLEDAIRMVFKNYDSVVNESWRRIIASFDLSTATAILEFAVALVVIPIVFIAVFSVLNLILFIVYAILCGVLGLTGYRKGFISSILGMLVGAVQGVMIAAIVLIPISGFAGLALELRTPLTSEDMPEQARTKIEGIYTEFLDDSLNNPLITGINKFGGGFVFNALTTAPIEGEKVNMNEQAKLFSDIGMKVLELKDTDWKAPNEQKQQILLDISTAVGDNKYTAHIVSGILRGVGKAINTGALEVSAPDEFNAIVDDIVLIISTSDKTNLKGDADTFLNIYFIIGESGVINAMANGDEDALLEALIVEDEDGTVVSLVIGELDKNPRTQHIISTIAKLSVSIMAESLGLDEETTMLYTEVKEGLKGALELNAADFATEEEYKEAVGLKVDQTLTDAGIELESEIVDGITDYIAENYSDLGEISDADIDKALLSYYDSYIAYQNGEGEAPALPEDIIPGETQE